MACAAPAKISHRISRVCLGRKQRVESECARAVAKKTQHRVLVGSCCRRGRCGCGVDVGGLCRCLFRAMHLVHHGRTSWHTPNRLYDQIRRLTEVSEAKMWPATTGIRMFEHPKHVWYYPVVRHQLIYRAVLLNRHHNLKTVNLELSCALGGTIRVRHAPKGLHACMGPRCRCLSISKHTRHHMVVGHPLIDSSSGSPQPTP